MKTSRQFVFMVVVALGVAAVALLPRREEHAAVLASEGRHEEAIALLARQSAHGPGDPDALAALGRSYAALGDVPRALEALDAYLKVRPNDAAALGSEAELLLLSGASDRYLDVQARLVAVQPSAASVGRLIELYRLSGRDADELATLRTYAGRGMLDASQLERLGTILAERGDRREGREWLELADRRASAEASAGRLLLLELLIEAKETVRASERARAWVKAWHSPFLCGKLVLRLARSGSAVGAPELASDCVELMPDHAPEMIQYLAGKGRQDLAHLMLLRWGERMSKPSGPQLRAFVQASALVGDVGAPLTRMAQLARSGVDPAGQGELAEEVANAFGKPALAAIRPFLSTEAMLTRPLFAAELSLFEGNGEMARWFLIRVEPSQLSRERLADWLAMLHRVQTDREVVAQLTTLWSEGRLPPELLPQFADEAARQGQVRIHDRIWNSVRYRPDGRTSR
ncbi:tetratricopeptide repeat protein [Bradyrhizobium liaoningense]|uniref:CHAT domain-containing protein n=1 Tax=Bradyrhizobium liaoningense TaxID=43992 RepID=UPI001BA824B6|nr:tetratricopeptide repeat protein [Bradyrhizobium liaoningense]MBR0842121.1 tetratricopeptide repeat protein [Bradyrhizobium liaoningense]